MKDRLKKLFVLCATLFNIYSLQALEKDQLNAFKIDPTSISESEYVVVKDGHLSVNGKRQRYWAAVGKVYGNADVKEGDNPEQVQQKVKLSRKSTDIILNRLQEMGFNSVRLWDGFIDVNYTKDDGSNADCADYFISEAKNRGFKIWLAGMNQTGNATPENVDVINDTGTAEAWELAVAEIVKTDDQAKGGWSLRNNTAVFWDARLEALATGNKQKIAQHFNHHTGLRWCDDPVFGIWELSNEEWWIRRMVSGSWEKLPDFFRQELFDKWHQYLLEKYKTQENIEKAWGQLLPGENLGSKTILFAPMAKATPTGISLNDANQQAIEAVQAMKQEYNPEDFPKARGEDVLEFLVNMHVGFKKRQAATIKKLGRSTSLSPFVFDTGIGYEIQSQYLQQSADAVAHDAYVNGTGPDLKTAMAKLDGVMNTLERNRLTLEAERQCANEGRWVNWLLKPPGISQGVPWLEHNRIEGKPYLVYETQIQQPAKYRADFPLRLAALASIQDWDWVTWHYFGDGSLNNASSTENPFEKKLDITTGSHPQGYHYTYDEVQTSLMRAAGYIFTQHAWQQAPNPTTFIYGRKSLYDPQSMNYGHSYGQSGMDMLQTVYEHGVRIKIDTTREDDQVIGPVVPFDERNSFNPYKPTDEIVMDWKKGFFKADAPNAVAYTGRVASGGKLNWGNISMSNITVCNPEGMFDPVDPKNPWFAVSIYSLDKKPLSETTTAGISLESTSYNSNYQMGEKANNLPAKEGALPVLTARIGAKFKIPHFAGANYFMRNFNGQIIAEGKLDNSGEFILKNNQPVWFIELKK
ncbi:MAG TPA: hypothetical protein VFC67_15055 [Prolixibacteraceae bacterium]|nr:hypothetical protein [Prolixibacteraceae bacterium]